ncbi:hypothetical protein M885DRAFT_579473 [Pelagophyceae sp. CCMP2097]|nr:hypothetical protein M885DRAFT_579473 [Pelagophyceae sp. CCMP2097]
MAALVRGGARVVSRASRPVALAQRGLAWSPMQKLLPRHRTAADLYAEIRELTKAGGDYTVHNYMAVIEDLRIPEASVVETELFPRAALEFYTAWNIGDDVSAEAEAVWRLPERGGAQGDYRAGMKAKIANAVDCLKTHSHSKRAMIPIPFNDEPSSAVDWRNVGQTKCCRELYLYVDGGALCCTAVLRMQNASIFPKNIHLFAALLRRAAADLDLPVGEYTHVIANLCHDRAATQC